MADIAQLRVNNTDYDFADDTKVPYDLLQDTVGWIGKNLIPFPYAETSKTVNGLTYTVNSDGSVKINGTATALTNFNFNSSIPFELNEDLVFSLGVPSSATTFKGFVTASDNSGDIANTGNTGETAFRTNKAFFVHFIVYNGATLNNVTLYPMLRKADIMDNTYEPYNPSVKQVLRNNKIIEGKNLIPSEFDSIFSPSFSEKGVTCTNNYDGTFTLNGTATGSGSFSLLSNAQKLTLDKNPELSGLLILTGCPTGGGNGKYKLNTRIGNKSDQSYVRNDNDEGNGVTFSITDSQNIGINIEYYNGVTYNNLVFKPMIRKATETDPTYEQYYISGVVSQEAQNVLGAKNLLPYPYLSNSYSANGITFTADENGVVNVNGTATAEVPFTLMTHSFESEINFAHIPLILSKGFKGISGINVWINAYDNNNTYLKTIASTALTTSETEPFIIDFNDYSKIRIAITISNGTTLNNVKIYPMLRLAEIQDDTYVPYAMTNRDITEILTPIDILSELTVNSGILNNSCYLYKYGKLISGYLRIEGITANSYTTIAYLPAKYKPIKKQQIYVPGKVVGQSGLIPVAWTSKNNSIDLEADPDLSNQGLIVYAFQWLID